MKQDSEKWVAVDWLPDGTPFIWERKYTREEIKRATTRPDELIKQVLDGHKRSP